MLQLRAIKKINVSVIVLLIILFVPAMLSLFHPGFFLTDDGNWMVIRLSAFYESLRQGQFPPRFLVRLNHGYGYPVADFLYPLFLYIGIPIHIIGFSFVNTIKIIFGASIILSGICMFLWLKRLVKTPAAITGSIIYTIFPYHLFDLYQRGSVGEVLALGIVPFILWQIERGDSLFIALGIALLVLAHNSLALLFFPVILLYMISKRMFSLPQIIKTVVLALGLCAFFWIPALYDKQFTVFDTTPVSSITNYFLTTNTFYLFGWISVLTLLLSFPFLVAKRKLPLRFFWIITLISIFFTLSFSEGVWDITRIAPFFQFPYRFLSLTMLGVGVLAAIEVELLPKHVKVLGMLLLVVITYLSSWSLFFPKTFQYYPDTFYSTNQDSTTVKNEYMPIWVKQQPITYNAQKIVFAKGGGVLSQIVDKGSLITATVTNAVPSLLQVNLIYFPGWEVTIDGKKATISYDNPSGLIQFNIPGGVHTIRVQFRETPLHLLSDMLTLLSLFIVGMWVYKKSMA